MDRTSKSDPICVVSEYDSEKRRWIEVGRTAKWSNLHNPDFVEKFKVVHVFEDEKYMLFHLYDIDSKSPDLGAHDFLGFVKTTLSKLTAEGRVSLRGKYASVYRCVRY